MDAADERVRHALAWARASAVAGATLWFLAGLRMHRALTHNELPPVLLALPWPRLDALTFIFLLPFIVILGGILFVMIAMPFVVVLGWAPFLAPLLLLYQLAIFGRFVAGEPTQRRMGRAFTLRGITVGMSAIFMLAYLDAVGVALAVVAIFAGTRLGPLIEKADPPYTPAQQARRRKREQVILGLIIALALWVTIVGPAVSALIWR